MKVTRGEAIALATKLWLLTSYLSLEDVLLPLIVLNMKQKNITWTKLLLGLYLCISPRLLQTVFFFSLCFVVANRFC